MPGGLKPEAKCCVCGQDVIAVFHTHGIVATEFEYLHRGRDDTSCKIIAPSRRVADRWYAEDAGWSRWKRLKMRFSLWRLQWQERWH